MGGGNRRRKREAETGSLLIKRRKRGHYCSVSRLCLYGACSVARRADLVYTLRDDHLQVARSHHEGGVRAGPPAVRRPLAQVRPARVHPAAAVRLPGAAGAPEEELPGRRGVARRLLGPAGGRRPAPRAGPQHAVPGVPAPGQVAVDEPGIGRAGGAGQRRRAGRVRRRGQAVGHGQHLLRVAPRQPALRTAAGTRRPQRRRRRRRRRRRHRRSPKSPGNRPRRPRASHARRRSEACPSCRSPSPARAT